MALTIDKTPGASAASGLEALAGEVRRDFERLLFPAANWVPSVEGPDGRPALDVLIIGGGMCGQTAGFALMREGVRNMRIIDRAQRSREGPWGTYARMETLRSPKHLTGPDIGFPSLTFRAWYEAQHGEEGWRRLYKITTADWLRYLLWVRDTVPIVIENGVEATELTLCPGFVRVSLAGAGEPRTVYARKVILAGGRDGSGALHVPQFPSLQGTATAERARVFHSADDIDFARFRGGRIGVLGASASAFDNAAVALETGAAEVRLFSRRAQLPQINKSKWTVFPGFFHGYADLDDARRWAIYSYILSEGVPPPHESVLRCDHHAGFTIHFAEPWLDVIPTPEVVRVVTGRACYAFDAVILATGFSVDLPRRPELARLHDRIALWADRISREEAAQSPECARFPYLGPGFEFIERMPDAAPGLGRIHCFNAGATMSHAALAGDIPGLGYGANRLARAIARSLLLDSVDKLEEALHAHDDRELEPTRYFSRR
jgi:cation diffusion facilitator CzcD-associated flavoprotein CzcO